MLALCGASCKCILDANTLSTLCFPTTLRALHFIQGLVFIPLGCPSGAWTLPLRDARSRGGGCSELDSVPEAFRAEGRVCVCVRSWRLLLCSPCVCRRLCGLWLICQQGWRCSQWVYGSHTTSGPLSQPLTRLQIIGKHLCDKRVCTSRNERPL